MTVAREHGAPHRLSRPRSREPDEPEFEAVLAHEFGHFSQSSMKLGSYVYTTNRVVADVVYGRDWFDDMLGHACRIDIRIAMFAGGFPRSCGRCGKGWT